VQRSVGREDKHRTTGRKQQKGPHRSTPWSLVFASIYAAKNAAATVVLVLVDGTSERAGSTARSYDVEALA
jgi:hypothetical protein